MHLEEDGIGGVDPIVEVGSHIPSMSAFSFLAFSTFPVTLGFEGWQQGEWSG